MCITKTNDNVNEKDDLVINAGAIKKLMEWLEECEKYLDEDENNRISSLTSK